MNDRDNAFLTSNAFWISTHVRDMRDRIDLLRARPEWELSAQAAIAKAKSDIEDMLEILAECQRSIDDLPVAPTELTDTGWQTLQAAE